MSNKIVANSEMNKGPACQDPELLRRLLRAKDRMDAASHEAWPVQRLARVSGVSEAHFARSFKEAFGVPPHRYLLTRRIERATALLRDTELPITEIAFQTGWESLGTFGRTFRDITGESPSALRARARAATHALDRVPACVVSAAHRPDLTIAVSEKRRREADGTNEPQQQGGPMSQGIEVVGLYVRDQDEALAFYVDKLGFRVHTDVRNGDYRWLTVQHPDQPSFQLGLFTPGPPVLDAATAQAAARDRGQGRDAAAGAGRGRLPRGLRADARARRGVHAGAGGPLWQRGRRLPRSVGQRLEDDPDARLGMKKAAVKPPAAAKPVLLSGGNPQIAKGHGDAPVQAYIAAMPGWKQDLGRRLDALIVRTVPAVSKAVKWNSPFYGIEGDGWFLSLHCFTRYVKVAFFRGTSLQPVPPGTSKHKEVRYLDIHEDDVLDEAQFVAWVKQASKLPGERM